MKKKKCNRSRKRPLDFQQLEARQLLAADVVISEFLASNQSGLQDGFLETSDWIELHNQSTSTTADLSGYRLTDDANDLSKWTIPAGVMLAANDRLVIFASGRDLTSPDEDGFYHTNFSLSAGGEYLALSDDSDVPNLLSEFGVGGVDFPAQEADISFGIGGELNLQTLIGPEHPVTILAPATSGLGQAWTQPGFNDSAWLSGNFGVGFDTGPVMSGTFGPPLQPRALTGSSVGSIWSHTSDQFSTAGDVTRWSIHSPINGLEITPLILERDSLGVFQITGIGETQITNGSGLQSFDFNLEEGSAEVGEGYYFAWKDGDQNSNTGYSVPYTSTGSNINNNVTWFGENRNIALNGALEPVLGLGRIFSVQAEVESRTFDGAINTEISTTTDSAYVRSTFSVADTDAIDLLTLNLQYNDGVVVYLNGTEVFSNFAPANPAFDSTATGSRSDAQSLTPEVIDISNFSSLLVDGENVLALQTLNFNGDDDLLISAELTSATAPGLTPIFFTTPTPGTANDVGVEGFVADTTFSVDRGFYNNAFTTTVSSATPGATLVYTTDGSEPTLTNGDQVFLGLGIAPSFDLPISTTTTLRAAAFKTGFLPTNVDTQTYVFAQDVADGLRLDDEGNENPDLPASWNGALWGDLIDDSLLATPTVSIVTSDSSFSTIEPGVANAVDDEVPASIELIYPDGTQGFQINAGVSNFGGDSLNSPKKNTRIAFRSEFGPGKLNFPIFGDDPTAVTSFDNLILHGGSHDTWFWRHSRFRPDASVSDGLFFRNRWAQDRQLELGHAAPHGRFVQVYINGEYYGLHSLAERPDDDFLASYFGGDSEDYEAINSGQLPNGGGSSPIFNSIRGAALSGNFAAVEQLLDVDNYIDYMLLEYYSGNDWDWNPNQNWRAGTGLNGETGGYQLFTWDSDVKLRDNVGRNTLDRPGPNSIFPAINQIPEFQLRLADRIQELFFNDGIFTPERVQAQFTALADEVRPLVIAESARWGNTGNPLRDANSPSNPAGNANYTPNTWEAALTQLQNSYGAQRTGIVVQDFLNAGWLPSTDAPSYLVNGTAQHGGTAPAGSALSITAPEGVIYYTTDGSDPRAANGQPAGILFGPSSSIDLNGITNVKSRAFHQGEWSALSQTTFIEGVLADPQDAVRITEINYNPTAATTSEIAAYANSTGVTFAAAAATLADSDEFEFIEVTNVSPTSTLNLNGLSLANALTYNFGDVNLLAGERAVVVENLDAFEARYGTSIRVLGQWSGGLSNSGERIDLQTFTGEKINSVPYNDRNPFSVAADGNGATLVLDDPGNTPAAEIGKYYNWRASVEFGGTPGADSVASAGVVINEVLAHTDLSEQDSVELFNPTANPINIGGWYLSDSGSAPFKYQIPAGTVLAAGDYIVFDEDDFNPTPLNPGVNDFALSSTGDQVYLTRGNGGAVLGFEDVVEFGATFNGSSLGRLPDGTGRLSPLANRSLGSANGVHAIGDLVISEINYHPGNPSAAALAAFAGVTENDLEFIEIYNRSGSPVDLTDHRLRGEVDFDFPGISLGRGQSVVVTTFDPDPADPLNEARTNAFRAHYGIGASVTLVGGFTSNLSNSFGRVTLQAPDTPDGLVIPRVAIDEVLYDDLAPFPISADGTGDSLHRVSTVAFGNDGASFVGAAPTPGTVSLVATAPTVIELTRDGGGTLPRPDLLSNLAVTFDVDVNISVDDLVIRNDTLGGTDLDTSGLIFSYNPATKTAEWNFGSLTLEAAFYSFELSSDIVSVVGNLSLDGDNSGTPGGAYIQSVYVALPGDADLDGRVSVIAPGGGDGFALVQNLGSQSGNTWEAGDFDGDGAVTVIGPNGGDGFIFVQNIGRDVRPPANAPSTLNIMFNAVAAMPATQSRTVSSRSTTPVLDDQTALVLARTVWSSQNDDGQKASRVVAAKGVSTTPLALASHYEPLDKAFASDDWF